MFIANEGKKNLEAKANFIDPRGGCGCACFLFIFSTDRILSYIPDHNRCFLNSAPSAAHK